MQRINYINRNGFQNSRVLKIIKKQSKGIRVLDPEDNHEFIIPRNSVDEILDLKYEKPEKEEVK